MTQEQDTVALNQALNARRESEEARKANILARLRRAISTVMAALGVPLGPVLPETLVAEVGCLPDVVQELELSTASGCTECSPCSSRTTKGWTAWR
jgi:hypothetical protein